jgi:hypothetical protein
MLFTICQHEWQRQQPLRHLESKSVEYQTHKNPMALPKKLNHSNYYPAAYSYDSSLFFDIPSANTISKDTDS